MYQNSPIPINEKFSFAEISTSAIENMRVHFKGLGPLNSVGKLLVQMSLKKNLTKVLETQMKMDLEKALKQISIIDQLYVHVLN